MNIDLEKRILKDKTVTEDIYINSLLNITELLTTELVKCLKEEGRYSGMAKSYIDSMWDSYTNVNGVIEDEEEDIFDRINYLLKPSLIKEYKSLRAKSISPGDCFIVILRKIYSIIQSKTSLNLDFQYTRELRTLSKLINRFFDNIKNPKKNTKLFNLSDTIKYCMENGVIGKYGLCKIDFPDRNKGPRLVEVLDSPGERIWEDNESKLTEITWNDLH